MTARTYTRSDDGAEMIEVKPHVFVNALSARLLHLVPVTSIRTRKPK